MSVDLDEMTKLYAAAMATIDPTTPVEHLAALEAFGILIDEVDAMRRQTAELAKTMTYGARS